MTRFRRQRWTLFGVFSALGLVIALVVLGVGAGVGSAAGKAAPQNTSPPTLSGTPQQGQTLSGGRGQWDGAPTDYNDFWTRCDSTGGSCANISGANARTYVLKGVDVGNTIRYKVQAKNADGNTSASSVPSAARMSLSTASWSAKRGLKASFAIPLTVVSVLS